MTAPEWIGILAAMVAIATAFLTALRWMVHQFVREIGAHLSRRMDKLETEIGVLTDRQSQIYETIMAKGGLYGATKTNKTTKSRSTSSKRIRRKKA